MDIVRLFNNFKRLIKIFQQQKYAHNSNAPVLSKEQLSALNIGAITSEQNMYYCDCLETEPDKEDVASRINEYYGVYDRDSALETLEWLLSRGHHIYYNAIMPVIANISSKVDDSHLSDFERDRYLGVYINNIKETLQYLISYGFMKSGREFKEISIEAWDLSRLVLVARCCYDVKYISEGEAWEFIMAAYRKAKEIYPNWSEFAKGYVVGRCMWSGRSESNFGIFDIANGLLKDDNSPWTRYQLH